MLYRYGPAYVYSIRYSLPTLSTLYKLVIPSPARYITKGGIIINYDHHLVFTYLPHIYSLDNSSGNSNFSDLPHSS